MQTPFRSRLAPWVLPAVVLALLLAASAAAIGAGAGLGARLDWWHFSTGFALLRWAARVGAAAAVAGLLAAGAAAGVRRWGALGAAAVAVVLGLTVLGIPRYHLYKARRVPPIHDITTDWEQPPPFRAVLPLREGAPNPPAYPGPDVANQQRRHYADIRPAYFEESPAAVFAAARSAAARLGWEVVAAVPAEGRIEATDTTFWFGFTDDIVVRIRPADGATRVDVRSKSRVGGSDIGTNAARIRAFLARLRAELTPAEAPPGG